MKQKIDWSLYLVTDRALCKSKSLEEVVMSSVSGGVSAVQLREKNCSTREFVELGRKLKTRLAPLGVPLVINDRADVAIACDADGVHLGQTDLEYLEARRILGRKSLIGLTVENETQVDQAESWDVDYLGVSPIFETSTKLDVKTTWGVERLALLRNRSRHKLIAIGGIHIGNLAQVIRAGADGVAVASAICENHDPEWAARALRREIEKAKGDLDPKDKT